MNDSSRLDAAYEAQSEGEGEWYRSPLALVAALVIFIGILALIVLAVTGGDDTADAPVDEDLPPISFGGIDIPEVDAVTLTGDRLPPPPTAPGDVDEAIGVRAPGATATSLGSGTAITLDGGRARVIGFFAHWCPHCQRELPDIVEWLAENELPPNTEFVAVSTAVDEGAGNYPPSDWFTDVGFASPVVIDDADGTLLKGFGFSGFPAFVAIDASGTVVDRATGNIGTERLAELFQHFAS